MTPADSPAALEAFTAARGIALSASKPRDGLAQMLAFYELVRADGCAGPDGDMLLFQWGTYDWGEGRHFELDLTRQFIEQGLEDDNAISQLSLTYKFEATPEREALGEGNRWCHELADLASFRAFVLASPPYAALADSPPVSVEVDHSFV
jgi:hypothetical protein